MFLTLATSVEKVIDSLKDKKNPGYDGIRAEILKSIKAEISQPLTFVCNRIIITACFPECLRIGMRLFYKSGTRNEI